MIALLFLLLQFTVPMHTGAPHGGAPGPTITVTSALCVNSSTGITNASCTLGASGSVGDLLIVRSKTASATAATVTYTFTGTSSCTLAAVVAPVFQSNGGAQFTVSEAACIINAAGASTPIATWAGSDVTFADIEAFTVHTTNTWKTTFVDQTASNIVTSTSTSCPTGTTSATTNVNDFILATCDVFNVGQTQGALSGFTAFTAASRNTALVYSKPVTATGTQTATVPLSATDFGVGMIAAFASN